MTSRKTGSALDKNFIFLNTKGLCLLCYDECPSQILEKRRVTTQTSVNFTRLMSRYLGFSVNNVVVAPLKKVGRKCVINDQKNDNKKIEKIGFELCDRCEAVAQEFCEVQAKIELHQMMLNMHVRSISEIIKDSNKKTTAGLSEDDNVLKRQHKAFTRLTMGGLKSASILRNKLYKRSIQKLSKSYPIIKLKRICKSGDWIQLLNKENNINELVKSLPVDSKDLFASLLGCVVSLWIVLSLSFIQPEEYALKMKEEKLLQHKPVTTLVSSYDDLEVEINFQPKIKPSTQQALLKKLQRASPASTSSSIAQQGKSQLPLPPKFHPVVIHKHPNQIVQITKTTRSHNQTSQFGGHQAGRGDRSIVGSSVQAEPVTTWKPKSFQYPTGPIHPIQTRAPSPARFPVITPPSSSSHQVARPTPQYPMHPPEQYYVPPSTTNYGSSYAYPSTSPLSHHATPSSSISQQSHQYTNGNQSMNGNATSNYNYNYPSYNYNPSSTWTPPYDNTMPVATPPPASYSTPPAANGGYDPYSSSNVNVPVENGYSNSSTCYDYGYNYSNYAPSGHHENTNNYPYSNSSSSQYIPQSNSSSMSERNMYSDSGTAGVGYDGNHAPSYTTLLPPASTSTSSHVTAPSVPTPMEVDTANTSTSEEPSLTYEDPQSLDSEENSSLSADDHLMEGENDEQQSLQVMFPESHWRQQGGSCPPISCHNTGCTERFITQAQLQLHLLTHGEFQCNFCHLTFSKAHNLAQHEKMRHSKNITPGKSKCPRCSFTSTSQYKYFLHFLTYHLGISLYDRPCQICSKPFILGTKTINRKNHFKWYHDVEGKDPATIFTCKGCAAQFLKEAQLRDHQPNCTAIASVSSVASSMGEITYNTAIATADQLVI